MRGQRSANPRRVADVPCPICGQPMWHKAKMCSRCYKEDRRLGWVGDAATDHGKRQRAHHKFKVEGTCQHDGCDKPAVDRHHIDGDPGNNEPSNIALLCRRHHMEADGRLDAFRAAGESRRKPRPSKPCVNCGRPSKPLRRGRCSRCDGYWRRNGREWSA